MKLNLNQRKVIADISGNLAIALISVGVISQIVTKSRDYVFGTISFFMFLLFFAVSVIILNK